MRALQLTLLTILLTTGCQRQPDLTEEQKRGLEVLARIANPDPLLERQSKAHNALCDRILDCDGPLFTEFYNAQQLLEEQYAAKTQAGVTEEAVQWYEAEAAKLLARLETEPQEK